MLQKWIGDAKTPSDISLGDDFKYPPSKKDLDNSVDKLILFYALSNDLDFVKMKIAIKRNPKMKENYYALSLNAKDIEKRFNLLITNLYRHHKILLPKPAYHTEVIKYDFENKEYLYTEEQKKKIEEKEAKALKAALKEKKNKRIRKSKKNQKTLKFQENQLKKKLMLLRMST